MSSDDDIDFLAALAQYRDESDDRSDFVELETAVQHEILSRAQGLKAEHARERRG